MWSNHTQHPEIEDNPEADPEKTLVSPRFDDEATSHVKRAVPLSQSNAKRSKTGFLITTAIIAGLLGGILGSVLAIRYINNPASPKTGVSQSPKSSEPKGTLQADEGKAPLKTANTNESLPSSANQQVTLESDSNEEAENVQESSSLPSQPDKEPENSPTPSHERVDHIAENQELRQAFTNWFAAHKAGDIDGQMGFYNSTVNAFYRSRGASRADVRAEKTRVFERADTIHIEASEPEVKISPDGQHATILYRKRYRIEGQEGNRNGEVLQELRWQRVNSKWRIVSERDLKVLR